MLSPTNPQEVFNLRHAMLRNAVERVFGILKKRFPILSVGVWYPFPMQVRMVYVAVLLHNFILANKPNGEHDIYEQRACRGSLDADQELAVSSTEKQQEDDRHEAGARRARMASAMWASYQQELTRRSTRSVGVGEQLDVWANLQARPHE
jgi:hypothetical protein